MQSVSLECVLACPALPSLPAVAVEVLALASDPQTTLADIARVVQNDSALCAKILKTVNSSYYGLAQPCSTISRAVSLLGLNTVKSLVLGFSLVDCARVESRGFDLIAHWQRGVYSAAAARRFALLTPGRDAEVAFLAALMQDLGVPALYSAIGEEYLEIMRRTGGDHNELPRLEMEAFGFHHGEAGAKLGELWRLPSELIDAMRFHHTPNASMMHRPLLQIVALGNLVAEILSTDDDASSLLEQLHQHADLWFGLSSEQITDLLETIVRDAAELSQLFQLDIGAVPDINALLARAQEIALEHQLRLQREAEALRQSNRTLARLAVTDALTGAVNRKGFDTELSEQFAQARAFKGCLALLMLDVDHFKQINDAHGHQVGDAALVELAHRIQSVVGESGGTVCRYGGEEFGIIVPGADRRAAAQLAESIRLAVAAEAIDLRHLQGAAASVQMTVSIGAAALEPSCTDHLPTAQLLVHAADRALYAAKNAGRNCVRVFTAKAASTTT